MNVYDFDKTIYKGDCTVDFYFYQLKKHPSILKYSFKQIAGFAGYFLGLHDKTMMKMMFYPYLESIEDIESDIKDFWDKNIHKINSWYFKTQREDDVVISASAEFMVKPACERLGIKTVIGSIVDPYNGEVHSKNCHGQEKVERFIKAGFDTKDIEDFYSDSTSDTPLALLAKRSFMVKGEKLEDWPGR